MTGLVGFLRARVREENTVAVRALLENWVTFVPVGRTDNGPGLHIASCRECSWWEQGTRPDIENVAMKHLGDEHRLEPEDPHNWSRTAIVEVCAGAGEDAVARTVLRLLAHPYQAHDEFDPAWSITGPHTRPTHETDHPPPAPVP